MMRALILALTLVVLTHAAQAAPAMWEARDADSRIRLFGSVHVLPPDLKWRTETFDAALEEAHLVVFESNISGAFSDLAMMVRLTVAKLQTRLAPWVYFLSHAEWETMVTALETAGLDVGIVYYMPPWLVSQALAESDIRAPVFEVYHEYGVEGLLQQELPMKRKSYFETPGETHDLAVGNSIRDQIDELLDDIEQMKASRDRGKLRRLIGSWVRGSAEDLQVIATTKAEIIRYDRLLAQRNRNWLPRIEAMLADNEDNLVIVGAAHLVGEDNVLDLLRDAGYTVTRIQ